MFISGGFIRVDLDLDRIRIWEVRKEVLVYRVVCVWVGERERESRRRRKWGFGFVVWFILCEWLIWVFFIKVYYVKGLYNRRKSFIIKKKYFDYDLFLLFIKLVLIVG